MGVVVRLTVIPDRDAVVRVVAADGGTVLRQVVEGGGSLVWEPPWALGDEFRIEVGPVAVSEAVEEARVTARMLERHNTLHHVGQTDEACPWCRADVAEHQMARAVQELARRRQGDGGDG